MQFQTCPVGELQDGPCDSVRFTSATGFVKREKWATDDLGAPSKFADYLDTETIYTCERCATEYVLVQGRLVSLPDPVPTIG